MTTNLPQIQAVETKLANASYAASLSFTDREKRRKYRHLLRGKGCVYALFNAQTGWVKLGFTAESPYQRAAGIATQSGCDVTVLGFWRGKRIDEIRLHHRFAAWRRKGEWFERGPELDAWLKGQGEDGFPICGMEAEVCNGEAGGV